MEFSGKELVKGEPDASSFPSGGLRPPLRPEATPHGIPPPRIYQGRDSLHSHRLLLLHRGGPGQKDAPAALHGDFDREAVGLLHLMGHGEVHRVSATVGPEQEYFLIDKELYRQRRDLVFCGRTLFGAPAPKGQEMEDHYFGVLRPRVSAYMHELDEELWKLGVPAKTKHNEVAPAQHELATVYDTVNIAVDHNQLTMEMMKKVADKHGLACLIHEKPFEGINGSGKHDNWSLITDTGLNLLNPGHAPAENTTFLLFLAAVIKAVDEYADLMRISVASASNDHRLGPTRRRRPSSPFPGRRADRPVKIHRAGPGVRRAGGDPDGDRGEGAPPF